MTKTKIAERIMRADVPNGNNRTYPMETLEYCVELCKAQTIFGILGAPSVGYVDLNEVSHMVRNLRIDEDGYLLGDVEVLQTDKGDILGQLLDEVQIDFRVSGTGDVDENGVVSNFKFLSIDAVYDGADL